MREIIENLFFCRVHYDITDCQIPQITKREGDIPVSTKRPFYPR